MTLKEKAELVFELTKEIVEESKDREDQIGGIMRTFGEEYVIRMKTFKHFFKDIE